MGSFTFPECEILLIYCVLLLIFVGTHKSAMMVGYGRLAKTKNATASFSCLLLVLSSMVSVTSGDTTMNTEQRIFPAYAIAVDAERTLNSSACKRELGVFRDAVDIRKLWALKVLDSSGQPKPGFLYSNNYWLGSRVQCLDNNNKDPFQINRELLRNASRFRKIEDEFPPFKLNYFVAFFRTNSTLQYHMEFQREDLVTLGLCLPDSCTIDHLRSLLEANFQERTLKIGELFAADFKLENVRDLQVDGMWFANGRMILVGCILVITLLLMIAATAYDVLIYQKYISTKTPIRDTCQNDTWKANDKLVADIPESAVPVRIKRRNLFVEVLMCFSIYTNTKFIFGTKLGKDAIKPIHGMKFLGMTWIILLHTAFYIYDFMDNKPQYLRLSEAFAMQPITSGPLSVDSFFFLSGFLMAYLLFKQNLKSKTEDSKRVNYTAKVVMFLKGLLHRFLRLTPAYMMMIGIFEINSIWYDQTSLFYTNERPQDTCPKYWWRNLLYIHNLFRPEDMCLSWTWYLADDMQFYVIGTFVVLLSSIYFYTAATILLVILLCSTVLSGYISYINGYVPTLDAQIKTMGIIYFPPWIRIGPYIVGIVTAYILIKLNNKLTLRKRKVVALWVLGSAINLIVLFCMWKRQISVLSSAIYTALYRTVWGVGLAWVLIACCTNHGGIVNTILSFRAWVPFSRLTYCAYLINPLIIKSIYLQSEAPTHMDFVPALTMFLGILVETFICSYAYSLMMEIPYIRLAKLLTKPRT